MAFLLTVQRRYAIIVKHKSEVIIFMCCSVNTYEALRLCAPLPYLSSLCFGTPSVWGLSKGDGGSGKRGLGGENLRGKGVMSGANPPFPLGLSPPFHGEQAATVQTKAANSSVIHSCCTFSFPPPGGKMPARAPCKFRFTAQWTYAQKSSQEVII